MSNILFARPRHDYGSYADFYRLIELSGYPLVYFDEIDTASDNCYIMTMINGENHAPERWQGARARLILWDLEYHIDAPPRLPNVEVWAADAWYAAQIGARYVPMGSHPGLKLDTEYPVDIPYDAAYLGYMIPRRQDMWAQMKQRGIRLTPTSAWGQERHGLLMQSECYVHVHQHGRIPAMPPLRVVVAAAYSLPYISETVIDPGVFGYTHFMQSDFAHVAEFVQMWACDGNNRQRLNDYGRALHDLLCRDLTFRRSVEASL